MADTGWILATGEGEQILDSGIVHVPISMNGYVNSITSPRIRVLGTTSPKRIQYGGSCGWAGPFEDNDGAFPIAYGDPIKLQFERQYWWNGGKVYTIGYADRVWWKLPLGIEWYLKFYW